MKKNQVRRTKKKDKGRLNLRISDDDSEFLAKEKISPQKIFDLAVQELRKE